MVCRVATFEVEAAAAQPVDLQVQLVNGNPAIGELSLDGRLGETAEELPLTALRYNCVLKVSRTMADLDGADGVGRVHIAEALSYWHRSPVETSRAGEGAMAR